MDWSEAVFRFDGFLKPDFYFIVVGILESLSFLATSLILFRILTIVLSIGLMVLSVWTGLEMPGMKAIFGGALLNISLNVLMIFRFFTSRSHRFVPSSWREVYGLSFSELLPLEFRRLLEHGNVHEFSSVEPTLLIQQGKPFQELSYLVDGSAIVIVDGQRCGQLQPGDWISEITFLSGGVTSADVVVQEARVITWSETQLFKLQQRLPEVHQKLQGMIARNLCIKLIRSNNSLDNSVDGERFD